MNKSQCGCIRYKQTFLYFISKHLMSLQEISNSINVIPDHPEKGKYFRDISGLLINPELYDTATSLMVDMIKHERIDYICGLESKGYIFGQTLATKLNKGFVMLRKPNNMPNTVEINYEQNILTVQKNLIPQGSYVVIVDDILATGNSLLAVSNLMKLINCTISSYVCLIELVGLPQRHELSDYKIYSLIKYPANSEDKFISKADKLLFKKPVLYTPLENVNVDDNRIVVFSHPSMKDIADNIVSFGKYFREGGVKWSHSSDNYPLIKFENIKHITNKRIVFLGSLYNRANFSEQLSLLTMLPKCTIKSLDIFIPYFSPGFHRYKSCSNLQTNARENTLSTAESYAKIISKCLVSTQEGPPRIHIFDIHSETTKSWFSDSAIVNMDTAIILLKEKVDRDITTIVFPDQQIQDKYFDYFSDFRIYNVDTKKTINWPATGYDQNSLDNILIIDDWVQSGDVLEKCRLEMIKKGAKYISAYATHAVFTNGSYKNAVFNNFEKIYVTNSIPEITTKIESRHPFKVLKLDGLIRDKLLQMFSIKPTEIMIPKQYNVYVASENQTKLIATYDAINYVLKTCEKDDYNLKIYGVDVPSHVSEQPVNEETLIGCKNRLENLKKYVEFKQLDCDFFVSIESGVYYDGELTPQTHVRDHCNVIVVAKSDKHTAMCQKLSTEYTIFPTHFMLESMQQDRTVTVGNLIEKAYGFKAETWHERFGNKISRYEMIFNTIVESFGATCGEFVE